MKRAYKAILRGDRVEWLDDAPEGEQPLEVSVIIGEKHATESRDEEGKSIIELFQALADSGAFADIDDPVAWQREQRKDRPLPGRDLDVD